MTDVGYADLSRILQTRRNECSAIVTSRKRKLRQLFAVATQVDTLPNDGLAHPDEPAATSAEWQFLQAGDILKGKALDENNIPSRPRPSLERLRRLLAESVCAATTCASVDASVSIDRKDPSEVRSEATTADSVLEKTSGLATPATKISTSNGPEMPFSRTLSRKPSPGSQTPNRHAEAAPEPAAVFKLSTKNTAEGDAPSYNGEMNGIARGDGAVKRPTQVKFPLGTKGGSSPQDQVSGVPMSLRPSDAVVKEPPDVRVGNSPAKGNELLTIKPSADPAKVPEALSTPGSTAPSVATPAVHDVSTDTSPECDAPRHPDMIDRKELNASSQVESPRIVADVQHQGSSAHGQLLEESLQSSVSAKLEDEAAPSPTGRPPTKAEHVDGGRHAIDGDTPLPTPASLNETGQQSSSAHLASVEVLDSDEATPEAMDSDAHQAKSPAPEQTSPSPTEARVPCRDAPATSPTERPPSREQVQQSERPVTRVSSGAMRLKSVTEIVGGLARLPPSTHRDATAKGTHDQLTPVTSTPQSPASRARHSGPARKNRAKSHASTVLFGKQPKRVDNKALIAGHKEMLQASDDYYTPLFVQNFTGSSKWMQPLERILFQANKTISTPDAHLVMQDHQACRVLRRVYHLQQHDKWSLRQPKRCPEPTRPPSHWDLLLQEMKWMRTDFREERKWKMVLARNLAHACVQWHEAGPDERKCLQIQATIPPRAQVDHQDTHMADAGEGGEENQPTPDLVSSGDAESPRSVDDLDEAFIETVAPSAIFALQEDDVVFRLRRTAASDKLLDELPMYGSPLRVPKLDTSGPEFDPDAHWRRIALPLSKYVEGEMKLASSRPPQTRSRYDYEDEEEDDKDGQFVADQLVHIVKLPPRTGAVSFFNPESKHIRDRLHAGHQFRPPSEHPMPTQGFYESRSASQWTLAEDDELRGLVREYSYNWSLIASMLTTKSSFASGAERRTPWECFERWINLEGLPADMQKTQYFKAYNNRIETAQRVIAQQNQLAAQQASASGGAVTPIRRRPSVPIRVERRRNQKHLTMLDAMRKLTKKRETVMQKQQHSASQNGVNKKTNDALSQRPAKTPRDYSLMRWERDQALAEKMAQYAQRQEAQRRAAMNARAQAQAAQAAGAPGANMPGQAASHTGANPGVNGAARPMSNQLAAAAAAAAAGQSRPRMQMQAPANAVGVGGVPGPMNGGLSAPAQMNGTPQTQTQTPSAQGQHRLAMPNQQPDASLMLRAQRISEQQRAAVQIQQAQQQQQQQQQPQQPQQPQQHQQQGNPGTPGAVNQHSSPPLRNGINGINQQNMMHNTQAMMSPHAAAAINGVGAAQANGLHMPSAANTASPGVRAHPRLPPAIAAQLNHLEAGFRTKNPNMPPEQARQLATEQLTRAMMAQRQNAMNATAGASGQAVIAGGIAGTTSPHQYAALLRQQQQAQQQPQSHKTQHLAQPQIQHQQHQHHLLQQQQQQQRQQGPQQKASMPLPPQQQQPQQPHYPQHAAAKQGTPVLPAATPVAASASPVPSQQSVPSGSATPAAVGK